MENKDNCFNILNNINVNDHIEKKKELNYLSWPYAWAEVKKRYPNATYKVHLFGEKQLPYVFEENVGYMVFTDVTINDLTHTMWLPVLDSGNKTMLSKPYTYSTKKKKDIPVEAATMFDVNKTIMRCLVKNLAMFGLGLYIYSGEDLPEQETKTIDKKSAIIIKRVLEDVYKEETDEIIKKILVKYKIKSLEGLTEKQYADLLENINELKNNKN